MEIKKLPIIIVSIAVAIIVCSTILVPVINDSNNSIQSFAYNGQTENSFRMSYGTPSDNLTIDKKANESIVSLYLGESETPFNTVPLNTDGYTGWVLVTSSFSFGITGGAGGSLFDYTARYNNSGSSSHYGLEKDFKVVVNVTTGAISVTTGGNTYNWYDSCDVTSIYWADPNGDYINVDTASTYSPIYIEDPKDVYGSLMIKSNYVFWETTDNVETTNNKSATISTTTTPTDNGLYMLNSCDYSVTGSDDSVVDGHMSHCIVKYKVQGTPMINANAITSLLATIPLLVIIGILMFAVVSMIYTRK